MSSLRARRKRDLAPNRAARPRTVLAVILALCVLVGLIVLPSFAANPDEVTPPRAAAPASTSTTAPEVTSTTVAAEAIEAVLASMTDQERLAMQFFFMSAEEREAFARFIAPPAPEPVPQPAPEPTPAPVEVEIVPAQPVEAAPIGSVWDDLAFCEAGGNWAHPPVGGYGYSGGLMFLPSTWNAYGGGEFASQAYLASRDAQIIVAERILASHGGSYRAWPGCRAKLNLP